MSKKTYDVLLFDLDGTLTDTGEGIKKSIEYALNKQGITVDDYSELDRFIGPPLWDSFRDFCGLDDEHVNQAVISYRERYSTIGLYENTMYENMDLLLKTLYEQGKTIAVATSKPELYARQIVEKLGIDKYFTFVAGATFDGTRSKKSDVVKYAMENCGVKDLSKVVMIGDRMFDINGAKECGIDSIGILFGYGDREEHENAGATYIAENVMDILKYV